MTEVVAALIWSGEKFMICQRPAHKARGLLWEFVGGKVEAGETKEQALIRECREELAVTLTVGDVFMEVVHEYPDLTVHLTLFHAAIAEGVPQKLEHNDIRWITPGEIPDYDFCPADVEILTKIAGEYREAAAPGKRAAMLTCTYIQKGTFSLVEKPIPTIQHDRDAIVRVTLASICSSDLHIKHGSVPRAVEGITVGHEMVGIVEEVGSAVTHIKPGDRVTVNVETFCGSCFFCQKGYVNNCTDKNGGWALGCRIDGGQAEYVRVPFADQGLNKIPDTVSDRQALLVGDVLATGFWAARISEITEDDTVLIIGAGPTGICTLLCVMLKNPKRIIVCEKDENRIRFINEHYPDVLTVTPDDCLDFVRTSSARGGADVVLEVAGADSTFRLAWECARPNAIVTVVALYEEAQTLPLPDMYGKNLTFKTGGVDGCDCEEVLALIAQGKIDTEPLITHTFPLSRIEEAYALFEEKRDGVIKVAVKCQG